EASFQPHDHILRSMCLDGYASGIFNECKEPGLLRTELRLVLGFDDHDTPGTDLHPNQVARADAEAVTDGRLGEPERVPAIDTAHRLPSAFSVPGKSDVVAPENEIVSLAQYQSEFS